MAMAAMLCCATAGAQQPQATATTVAAGPGAKATLERFVGNISTFNRLFPQEKVYLHLDNTAYFRGETIWFSAYVVRADRPALTDMSRVLYVDLLDPTGETVATRKVKLDHGRGSGSFKLDKLLTSGFYEIRAYTRYMLNWDAAWAFSRVLPVFEAPKAEGDYSEPTMAAHDYRKRMPSARAKAGDGKARVRFFPEGGRLVMGLPSRVAFDVTGPGGEPLQAGGTLTMADGRRVAVETLREGRGVFDYTPAEGSATLTLTDSAGRWHEFELPGAEAEGCVLTVGAIEGDYVNVAVTRSKGYDEPLAMVLVNGGNVDAADILMPGERTARRRFFRPDMAPGVSQVALIDRNGDIVAERMVFVSPQAGVDTIAFRAEGSLAPCGKLALEAQTTPGVTFSLAVRDRAADANGADADAATWLLLSSELKGYIRNPQYYLEADDEEHRKAADLLMMVQGWRRYDVAQMAGSKEFVRRQPMEDGLYLFGQLHQASRRNKTAGVKLTATLYNRQGVAMGGKATTDSAGMYAFRLPDCEGEYTLLLNTTNAEGKAKNYRVGIDRNFAPAPRPVWPAETEPVPLGEARQLAVPEAGFDTLATKLSMEDRVHMIREVKVKGKRLFEKARAGWENEQRGAFKAYVRYDCDRAADEIYDAGDDTPTIFEWLAQKNPFFGGNEVDQGDEGYGLAEPQELPVEQQLSMVNEGGNLQTEVSQMEDMQTESAQNQYRGFLTRDGMSYKNRPIVWVLNNTFYMGTSTRGVSTADIVNIRAETSEEMPRWLDEYKSVYISEDEEIWRNYVEAPELARYSPVTIFLYSHHEFPAKSKGLRHTHFDGYSRVETFQMPDYSLMPPMADHRRTLYWNPAVKADKDGRARIELYNNSSCKQIAISAEGISYDGRAVVYRP